MKILLLNSTKNVEFCKILIFVRMSVFAGVEPERLPEGGEGRRDTGPPHRH